MISVSLGIPLDLFLDEITSSGGSVVAPSFFSRTEFYVQQTGSNLNAGSTTSDAALATYTNSAVAGWNSGTGVFEVASGNPVSDGVTVGMFASVYVTAGATVATFVARITAVTSTQITVSLTAKSGTAPSTDTAGARTLKVGGAWAGPSGSVGFPFTFVAGTMTNAAGAAPRVNYKNTADYTSTANWAITAAGITCHQAYASTPGDGGRARIKGPTTGASYSLLTLSSSYVTIADFDFQDNGATGSSALVSNPTTTNMLLRCSAHGSRGRGIDSTALSSLVECEGYDCNKNNSTYTGGLHIATAGSHVVRCAAHNNRNGTNGSGMTSDTSIYFTECLFFNNQNNGYETNADTNITLDNCDVYDNGGHGLLFSGGSTTMLSSIRNCNFVSNGLYGINFRSFGHVGCFCGNRFGAGTEANTSGDANVTEPWAMNCGNNGSYASNVTPWSGPNSGIFNIVLAAAIGAGAGSFTAEGNGFGSTVGYPDIGAAEKQP